MQPIHEVYAIKYAEHQRMSGENFINGDPHDGPMPMDYFVWLIKRESQVWVVDAGFDEEQAKQRGRTLLYSMDQALGLMDVDVEDIKELIVTHMHYDHIGNLAYYPNTLFHLQDSEMEYATGRYMRHPCLSGAFNVRDVLQMVEKVYKNRVKFHKGDGVISDGITVHRVGGHTGGLQVVRVYTQRGWVVLASDATHYYKNMEEGRPFPIVLHVGEMLEGYDILEELADSHQHIIPGHDPEVLKRYPAPKDSLIGKVAALHMAPIS